MIEVIVKGQYGYICSNDKDMPMFLDCYLNKLHSISGKVYNPITRKYSFDTKYVNTRFYTIDNNVYTIPMGLLCFLPSDKFSFMALNDDNEFIWPQLEYNIIQNILPKYVLRDDQIGAVYKALQRKRGIIQHPTGSGKTIIITALLKILCDSNIYSKFIVCVPYDTILHNMLDELKGNGINAGMLGEKDDVQVVVCNVLSLKNEKHKELLNQCVGIIYDECQHLGAKSYLDIQAELLNIKLCIGFSALVIAPSHFSSLILSTYTVDELNVMGITGNVISYIHPSTYIQEGTLATPVLFRVANTFVGTNEFVEWNDILDNHILSDDRLTHIANIICMFNHYGRKVLVLVGKKIQANLIIDKLAKINPLSLQDLGISFGGGKGYVLDHGNYVTTPSKEVLKLFDMDRIHILFGTTHLDEGADISKLDTVILASGGKNPRRLLQRIGRALRKTKNGKYAYIIDFEDKGNPITEKHSGQRLHTCVEDVGIPKHLIYKGIEVVKIKDKFRELEEIGNE